MKTLDSQLNCRKIELIKKICFNDTSLSEYRKVVDRKRHRSSPSTSAETLEKRFTNSINPFCVTSSYFYGLQQVEDKLNPKWDYENNEKLVFWWIVTFIKQVARHRFYAKTKLDEAVPRGQMKNKNEETHVLVKNEQENNDELLETPSELM